MALSRTLLAGLFGGALFASSLVAQSYQSPVFNGLGGNPSVIRHADLDEDGDQDLVIGDLAMARLIIVPVTGGAFDTPVILPLPSPMVDVAVEDLDGNGTPDIAALCAATGELRVFANDGNGGFPASTGHSVGISVSRMIAIELTGDGVADFLVARSDLDLVGLLINDGAGNFSNAGNAPGVFEPSAFAKGDLDGDGDMDLVVTSAASNVVLTVRNDGTAFTPVNFEAVGAVPLDVAILDTNHDLRPDIVTANTGGGSLSVLENLGGFGFARTDVPTPATPLRITPTNADNQLGLDLAVTCLTASQVAVFTNDGSGGFSQTFTSLSGANPVGVASIDINGDFADDLCVLDVPSGSIRYFENNGLFTPLYPGTGDDLELGTGVNGPALSGVGERSKSVSEADATLLRMFSPGGTFDGATSLLLVQLFYRGFPPITPIAGLHINEFGFGFILALEAPLVSPIGASLPFPFPAGLAGLNLMVQAIVPAPTALNGIFAASPGYELIIMP